VLQAHGLCQLGDCYWASAAHQVAVCVCGMGACACRVGGCRVQQGVRLGGCVRVGCSRAAMHETT
jgi:hypothetical protein